MGTTLHGQTLTVEKWSEHVSTEASQWDAWSGSVFKRKVQVFGTYSVYTITFLEYNVTWANSLALLFENDAAAGSVVSLYSDNPQRPVNPAVNVYILDVQFDMENIAGQNVRKVTVTVQFAQ